MRTGFELFPNRGTLCILAGRLSQQPNNRWQDTQAAHPASKEPARHSALFGGSVPAPQPERYGRLFSKNARTPWCAQSNNGHCAQDRTDDLYDAHPWRGVCCPRTSRLRNQVQRTTDRIAQTPGPKARPNVSESRNWGSRFLGVDDCTARALQEKQLGKP